MARYTITKKPLTPNTLWDADKDVVLCSFTNGKIETDDDSLAERLEALGHTVTANADDGTEKTKSGNKDDASGQTPDNGGADGDTGADANADDGTEKTATKGRRSRTTKK